MVNPLQIQLSDLHLESSREWVKILNPRTHMEDPEGAPGFQLQTRPTPDVATTWGASGWKNCHCLTTFLYVTLLNKKIRGFSLFIFLSQKNKLILLLFHFPCLTSQCRQREREMMLAAGRHELCTLSGITTRQILILFDFEKHS